MAISFNYNNFTSSYGMQQIPVVRPQDVATQEPKNQDDLSVSAVKPAAQTSNIQEVETPKASRIANLEDVSLTFNKEDTFDSIGTDADIASLDMTKAISDMRRDSILSDYQTFVGPSVEQQIANLDDGVVVIK